MTDAILVLDPHNTVFISDTHINHANIIKYCARPFRTVQGMNLVIWRNMLEADAAGKVIVHLGDVYFKAKGTLPPPAPLPGAARHHLKPGNHDYNGLDHYKQWFGTVHGRPDGWATEVVEAHIGGNVVGLSHGPLEPTRENLERFQLNLHGHIHNNVVFNDSWHVNCSVEVIDYRPIPWLELIRR